MLKTDNSFKRVRKYPNTRKMNMNLEVKIYKMAQSEAKTPKSKRKF